jgi:hypothetical protein
MKKLMLGLIGLILSFAAPVGAQNYTPTTNMSVDPDNSQEAQQLQVCLLPGTIVVGCGCWGYVEFGEALPAAACCSGYAMPFSCGGWCPGGGSRWYNRCTR